MNANSTKFLTFLTLLLPQYEVECQVAAGTFYIKRESVLRWYSKHYRQQLLDMVSRFVIDATQRSNNYHVPSTWFITRMIGNDFYVNPGPFSIACRTELTIKPCSSAFWHHER